MSFHRRVLVTAMRFGIAVLDQAGTCLDTWRQRAQHNAPTPVRRKGAATEPAIPGWAPGCLQAIIDGLDDEVMIITPEYRVRLANSALRRRLGAAPVVGESCFRLSHGAEAPCAAPWCECPLKRVLETGQTVRVLHTNRESQADQAGERWAEVVAAPVWDAAGHISEVIELVRDVSESRKLQKELLTANRELLALNFIGRTLSQSLDLHPTLQAVADTMLDALEAELSWIKLSDDARMPVVKASHGLPAGALDGLVEAAARADGQSATPLACSAVPGSPAPAPWQAAQTALKSKGVVLGVAGVVIAGRPFDQRRIQLLDAIGNQIALAIERCRLYEEIRLAGELRGELLHNVINAQEDERRRIARELHDEFGQALTALRLCLEKMALSPCSGTEVLTAQLAKPLGLCQQAEDKVDKLILDLRPSLIDDLGLVEAISSHAQSRLGEAGIRVTFKVTGEERRLANEKEVALFRIFQEAISNVIRHSGAGSVTVHLHFKKNELVADIEDDGCGFDAGKPVDRRDHRGMGLPGMKERMGLIGGSLSIVSKPGAGTSVKATVPLDKERVQI